jgi:hypothetical protein
VDGLEREFRLNLIVTVGIVVFVILAMIVWRLSQRQRAQYEDQRSPHYQQVHHIRSLTNRMCDCPERLCATEVTHDMQRWRTELGLDTNRPDVSADESEWLDRQLREYYACEDAARSR